MAGQMLIDGPLLLFLIQRVVKAAKVLDLFYLFVGVRIAGKRNHTGVDFPFSMMMVFC